MKLIDLIRHAAEELAEADPRQLADQVAKLAPSRELRDLLAEAATESCREYLRTQRNQALDNARKPRKPGPSKKLAGYREWWADVKASMAHIGDKGWKPLGDCTVDDLLYCVEARREEVKSIENRIADYETLITLLRKTKVCTVKEIPYEVAEKAFGSKGFAA
jgi:hypothetical protein